MNLLSMDKKQIEQLMRSVKEKEATRHIHIPHQEATGKIPDFEVEYEFSIALELKDVKPSQGMRPDFLYEGDVPEKDGIHMIWPELLEDGEVIRDKTIKPAKKGRALMWILVPETREKIHRKRVKVGTKGYWVIGSNKLARVTVTKIIGLLENKE